MTKTAVNKTTDVAKVQQTLSIAFGDSAACQYLITKFEDRTATEPLTKEEIYQSYSTLSKKYMAQGGFLLEAGDYDCVAVVVPPLENHAKAQRTKDPLFNKQFIEAGENYKKALGLGTKLKMFYLFMIGKNLNQPEVRGSARAILEYLKEEADKQDAAVILEAINEKAKKVYEYFGFMDYGEINYGKGEVNSQGEPDSKGEGFKANFMVYYKGGKLPIN